jgi:hypothetical protein
MPPGGPYGMLVKVRYLFYRTAGRIECCFKASPVRMIQFGKSKRQTVHSIKNDIRFLSK